MSCYRRLKRKTGQFSVQRWAKRVAAPLKMLPPRRHGRESRDSREAQNCDKRTGWHRKSVYFEAGVKVVRTALERELEVKCSRQFDDEKVRERQAQMYTEVWRSNLTGKSTWSFFR